MISSFNISVPKLRLQPMLLLITAAYMLVLWMGLSTYLLWQSVNFILGLVALVIVTKINPVRKESLRFAWFSIMFALLSCLMPVKTLLFISLVFAVFFLIESYFGRINFLPLLVAGFMSPFFQYLTAVFSFPIRLKLTEWAGSILNSIGVPVVIEGSVIMCRQQEFTVDTSCMGIKMMATSLLLSIILLAIYERKAARKAGLVMILVFISEVILLNIISNLIRIVCLIQFAILPSSVFHEVAGLLCMILYVIVPSIYSIKWMLKKWGRVTKPVIANPLELSSAKRNTWHLIVIASLFISVFKLSNVETAISNTDAPLHVPAGYTGERLNAEVVKLENKELLVYLKVIPDFFNPDHNPMICWKGSGYSFEKIQQDKVGKNDVYTAKLMKGKEVLNTAWWYTNGTTNTISQSKFRWDIFRGGDNYTLVNVTAESEEALRNELAVIFNEQPFRKLLTSD